MSDDRYVKVAYLSMLSGAENDESVKNWATLVRDLLCSIGLSYAWHFQGVGDEPSFLLNVKQVLKDQYVQAWQADMQEGTARMYCFFQPSLMYASYLNNINCAKFRIALTRFR